MIFMLDDFDDDDEAEIDAKRRRAHADYMDGSPASGNWWRTADDGDMDRAPDGAAVRRRPANGRGYDVPLGPLKKK